MPPCHSSFPLLLIVPNWNISILTDCTKGQYEVEHIHHSTFLLLCANQKQRNHPGADMPIGFPSTVEPCHFCFLRKQEVTAGVPLGEANDSILIQVFDLCKWYTQPCHWARCFGIQNLL